jgi:cytochrome c oxidase subunit 2
MTRILRPRQAAATVLALLLPVLVASCSGDYPNSTFTSHTEFNRDAVGIWNTMMYWGIGVFVLVEVLLIYVMIRYRRRPGGKEPEHVHGNTTLELAWTIAPVFVLAIIAVPTVKSIWRFQAPAAADALQIDVIGHQWWWEFRYPEYNITTANEVYLPTGRTVNFSLRSVDVIHSFWIPALGGKRDAMANRTNHIWFTPDSVGTQAFIGSCNEFCGASHANMRFRAFTVSPQEFDSWVAGQQANAIFPAAAPAAPAGATAATPVADPAPAPAQGGFVFPADQLPAHIVPRTPVPAGLTIDDAVLASGDAQRGFERYSRSPCIGCHRIRGNQMSQGVIGPDLTHLGSRHTIGAGLYPNDARHLALWLKNARRMKPMPGTTSMPTLGLGEVDPVLGSTVTAALGGLTDQEIADIVAYLLSLK